MASKSKLPTEAELTKMPKSEYMSAVQLKFFRERLLQLQKELRDNAGATTFRTSSIGRSETSPCRWKRSGEIAR